MTFGKERRGDQVPLVLAQSTKTMERLCSLLSALLFRQPAPPLSDRIPWQLVGHHHTQAAKPRSNNILLVVISEDEQRGWPEENFAKALHEYTGSSLTWFCWEIPRNHPRFQERLSQLLSTLSKNTDVYFAVGSELALSLVSGFLTVQEKSAVQVIQGILSVLPDSSESHATNNSLSLPYISDEIFHWMIHMVVNSPATLVSHSGARMVARHGRTICQTLPSRPPQSWLVRAIVWFASAVQTIHITDHSSNWRNGVQTPRSRL